MVSAFKSVQDRETLLLRKARTMEYKEIEKGENLSIHFYLPKDLAKDDKRPVILFFNDGGWDRGNVVQFAPQALYYVERGAVCGLVEYRNRSSHPDSTPLHSLQDGLSAVQFTRHHAANLHIDSDRLVVAGAGAGANIAGSLALRTSISEEDSLHKSADPDPNASILISPIMEVSRGSYGFDQFPDPADTKRANLIRYVKPGLVPMLIIQGNADHICPTHFAAEFAAAMKRKKNDCEYIEFEGRDHSFFNLNVDPVSYEASLTCIDDFLDRIDLMKKGAGENEARIICRDEGDY